MFKYKKNGPFFSNFVSLIFNIGFSQNFCQKNITQAEKYLEIIYFFCLSRTKTTSDLQRQRLGLQISGISRKQKLSMLVSIGAQHSHLDQVLLPILPSTSIVVASLLLTRSLVQFLPLQNSRLLEPLIFVDSRAYGYKPKFWKSLILSVSDSVPEDILSNKIIRKTNLIILFIVPS